MSEQSKHLSFAIFGNDADCQKLFGLAQQWGIRNKQLLAKADQGLCQSMEPEQIQNLVRFSRDSGLITFFLNYRPETFTSENHLVTINMTMTTMDQALKLIRQALIA